MSIEPRDPAFSEEEHEILSQIVPEAEPVEPDQEGQTTSTDTPTEEKPADAATTPEPTQVTTQGEAEKAQAAEAATTTEPAQVAQEKPQGDVRSALRSARQSEKRLRAELEQTRQQLQDLREGKHLPDNDVTEEELAQLEADFPAMAKVVRRNRELESQIRQVVKPQIEEGSQFQPPEYAPEVQMVIDEVPDLLAWQHDPAAQDRFLRAVEYDQALLADPDWKGKTAVERFTEAARRTKAAFGQPAAATTSTPPATPANTKPADPAAALAAAQTNGPKSISDFRGGQPPTAPTFNYDKMSDEAILASLPVGD